MTVVCLDLRALQIGHQNRGIGMYLRSVLEHLPDTGEVSYIFYCFEKNNPIESLGITVQAPYKIVTTPTINTVLDSPKNILGIFKLINHSFEPLRQHKIDTFVQFDFMLGLPKWKGVKKIVIGYDLIPLIKRNEYIPTVGYAWYHTHGKKAKIKSVLRALYYQFRFNLHYKLFNKADRIICISHATEKSFKEILKVPSSKLTTIHLAPVSSSEKPEAAIANKINKPYVFYIGGTDGRKKIQDIVYAFNIARSRGDNIALVLAGNEFQKVDTIPDVKGRNAILRSPYRKDIHLAGFISNEEKLGLYQNARAFIFTSTFEGFGLPVIEAMSASCPVITYNNSSIPEAAGDAAILVETNDYIEIANQISKLRDTNLREEYISRGLDQSSKFNWKLYIDQFVSEIR